ncbi:MAG: ferritin family protein [Sedimentisphaerales bacterium]|nr:ferritin family protein [Sedimentisphaerales bacterium]
MQHFENIDEIFDFATALEDDAYRFFKYLSNRAGSVALQNLMDQFAEQELEHKKKIASLRAGKELIASQKVDKLKIPEHPALSQQNDFFDYDEMMNIARKKESASFRIYDYLAKTAEKEDFKKVFSFLAQQEAEHKNWLDQQSPASDN